MFTNFLPSQTEFLGNDDGGRLAVVRAASLPCKEILTREHGSEGQLLAALASIHQGLKSRVFPPILSATFEKRDLRWSRNRP